MAHIGEQLTTPVALVIFNRPDKTQRVFEQIRIQKPHQFFVISDGPRDGHPEDIEFVRQSRLLTESIDWECEVVRLYSETNLGCKNRIISGLNQLFDQVSHAIILEDDCLPHQDFFPFAQELLTRFKDHPKVFSIGGHIWEFPDQSDTDSYFFSKYLSVWGWATWADRWRLVDPDMTEWPMLRSTSLLKDLASTPLEFVYWQKVLDMTYEVNPALSQAWDYTVQLAMWKAGMLAIRPHVNLIQNIGLDSHATHTRVDSPAISSRVTTALSWPFRHPVTEERKLELDARVNEVRIGGAFRKLLTDRT